MTDKTSLRFAMLIAVLAVTTTLSACAPLLIGGAVVGGSMVVTDRRTSGAQVEDQAIELKVLNRAREAVGERGHISVTSYNRLLLITGEAATDADKAAVEQAATRVENVRSIVNELAVMGASSLTSGSGESRVQRRGSLPNPVRALRGSHALPTADSVWLPQTTHSARFHSSIHESRAAQK